MRSMMKKGVFYINPHKMDAHLEYMNIGILEKLSEIEWETRQTKQGTLYVSYKTMTKEAAKARAEQLSAFLPTGITASNKEPNLFRVAVTTEAIEEYSNQKIKKSNGLR